MADVLQARDAGFLGVAVYRYLKSAGYEVSVFVQKNGTVDLLVVTDSPVVYRYLTTGALKGHDAMVSVFPMFLAVERRRIVWCTFRAGITRFVAIDPGWSIRDDRQLISRISTRKLRIRMENLCMEDDIKYGPRESGLLYTLIYTGLCLNPGHQDTCLFDITGRSAHIYAGGDTKLSVSTCTHIALAIGTALGNPQGTGNRILRLQSLAITQRRLLQIVKTVCGAHGWTEEAFGLQDLSRSFFQGEGTNQSIDDKVFNTQQGVSRLALLCNLLAGGEGMWSSNDNELLGIVADDEDSIGRVLWIYAQYLKDLACLRPS